MNELPSIPSQEKISQQAGELIQQLSQLVDSMGFLQCHTPTDFIEKFNSTFTRFQSKSLHKLSPRHLSTGASSCTGASALAGVWWETQTGIQPLFRINTTTKYFLAHSDVVLPSRNIDEQTCEQMIQQFRSGSSETGLTVLSYLSSTGIQLVLPGQPLTRDVYIVSGLSSYLSNRLEEIEYESRT